MNIPHHEPENEINMKLVHAATAPPRDPNEKPATIQTLDDQSLVAVWNAARGNGRGKPKSINLPSTTLPDATLELTRRGYGEAVVFALKHACRIEFAP